MTEEFRNDYFNLKEVWKEKMEPYQVEVLGDILAALPKDIESIADVGCGNGLITNALPAPIKVVGVDFSREALTHVKREVLHADVTRGLPIPDNSYDLVMSNDMIEHLTESERDLALKEFSRVASKYILITVPFFENLNEGLVRCAACGHCYHRNHHLATFDIPTVKNFFGKEEFKPLIQIVTGAARNPYLLDYPLLGLILGNYSKSGFTICPHCGSSLRFGTENPDSILTWEKQLFKMYSKHPHADLHLLRNELITLFARKDIDSHIPQAIFLDEELKDAGELNHGTIATSFIDFTRPSLFRSTIMPSYSHKPLFFCDEVSVTDNGVYLGEGEGVSFSFYDAAFAQVPSSLQITGTASANAVLTIYGYDNTDTYVSMGEIRVKKGDFDIKFHALVRNISKFGMLYRIEARIAPVIMKTTGFPEEEQKLRRYYHNDRRAHFMRLPSDDKANNLFLSLPFYGEYFEELDWIGKISDYRVPHYHTALNPHPSMATQEALSECLRSFHERREARTDEDRLKEIVKGGVKEAVKDIVKKAPLKILKLMLKTPSHIANSISQRLELLNRKVMLYVNAFVLLPLKRPFSRRKIVMLVPDRRIDRRVLLEARSLVEAGWAVTVVSSAPPTPGDRDDEDAFPDLTIVRIDDTIPVSVPNLLRVSGPIFDDYGESDWKKLYWYHSHFFMEVIKRPARIYVAHDLPTLPAAAMAASRYGAFLVYDSHELYPEQQQFEPSLAAFYAAIEKKLSRLADIVITVNESIAQEMSERNGITLPRVLLNCPEVREEELPLPKTDILRKTLNIPPSMRILLFQGGFSDHRNLENLVSSMGLLRSKNVALALIGPGEKKMAELVQLATDHGVLGISVFFHRAVPQGRLLQYTSSADAGIIPYPHGDLNSYLCTPNKLFEFIVAGLPILANDSPELRRFVSGHNIGLNMPMTRPEDIANAIDTFFASDYEFFGENCKAISAQYCWKAQGEKLVSLYNELLHNTPKSVP